VPYVDITTGAGHPIRGGIADTGGQAPAYAVFCVVVDDVAATLERATELGGQVVVGPMPLPTGMVVGYLRDRDQNLFAIYSPIPGQQS
jgi:predicted enzyme related to lactoylglutathione lyase